MRWKIWWDRACQLSVRWQGAGMKHLKALLTLPLLLAVPAAAQDEAEPVTPSSVIANAAEEEWAPISADDLLIMELAPDAAGNPRTVVIQLIPPPFSQPWVENIRILARAHWWDGTSVNRVQDNYVTQWGDVTEEKPLPEGITAPLASYELTYDEGAAAGLVRPYRRFWEAVNRAHGADEETYDPVHNRSEVPNLNRDVIAAGFGFFQGWPFAMRDGWWPVHCYSYVGVGRNYAPDTGTGAELYTIIGQPQRHMDRNLAVVGRIIDGMEHMSSLPRGSGDLGFYTEEEAELRTPILSVRLASEMENAPAFEYLDTASESFPRYVHVRANRDDPFYTVPAGGVDVCSIQVPVRRAAE